MLTQDDKERLVKCGQLKVVVFRECGNCRHWRLESAGTFGRPGALGECKRHAPQIVSNVARWPIVAQNDYCGEFAAAAVKTHVISGRPEPEPSDYPPPNAIELI